MRKQGFYSPYPALFQRGFLEVFIMSEQVAIYQTGNPEIKDLGAFKNRACVKQYFEEGYQAPEPEEVKALFTLSGINKKDWAALLGVTYNEKRGSTTLRKWAMRKEASDYRQVPYSTWRLMLIYSGVVDAKNDVLELNNSQLKVAE